MSTTVDDHVNREGEKVTRRDFIHIVAATFTLAGGAAALWPVLDQMNPDQSALSQASVEFDLAPVAEGQGVKVMWRGKPIFVRHRTAEEIASAKGAALSDLPDADARLLVGADASAADENRIKKGHEKWLVLVGICTHLGCIPQGTRSSEPRGEFGGWFCSCHGSQYDTSGRIRKGPAPRNLDVPPYKFISDTKIIIGEV
jgi:ubiquinol-cytochrome c reductase iron-sulfur subunit